MIATTTDMVYISSCYQAAFEFDLTLVVVFVKYSTAYRFPIRGKLFASTR
jgi:hypothetical protein